MLLTGSQLTYRGIRPMHRLGDLARVLALHTPFAALVAAHPSPVCIKAVPSSPLPGDAQAGRDMISGIFCLAGQTIEKENLGWLPAQASVEWLEALHGFSWLRDLRSVGTERARRMAREMVSGWASTFSRPHEIAWRPDIIGSRLVSWISFYDFFCASADDEFRASYFASLIQQARHLDKALPKNLSGLARLRALKGLVWAGLALEDSEQWLERALTGIFAEIEDQILPDGGHISRNPQATFEWLHSLIDLRAGLAAACIEAPAELLQAIERLSVAVRFFRHADGAFTQFNGADAGNGHLCDAVLAKTGARTMLPTVLPDSGYHRLQQGRASLIMDAGAPILCAAREAAHAGLLSFEYSYGRDRVFVNCGAAGTRPARWRRVLRSTLAHCALSIDNRNAMPLDGDGLMLGRPAVRANRQDNDGALIIEAAHDGYAQRFGIAHHRCLCLQNNGSLLTGEERLSGGKTAGFAARFHLHPNIEAIFEGDEIILRARSGTTWRFTAEGADMSLEESIYAGGSLTPAVCAQIILSGKTSSGQTCVRWRMEKQAS